MDEMKKQLRILSKGFNLKLRDSMVPKLSVMKRIVYAVKHTRTFPSEERVPLTKLKVHDYDSNFTMFRRLVCGTMLASAGELVTAEMRDDGAGANKKLGVLWCNPEKVVELLGKLDDVRDRVPNDAMGRVCALMQRTLHECGGFTGISLSLALTQQRAKVRRPCN